MLKLRPVLAGFALLLFAVVARAQSIGIVSSGVGAGPGSNGGGVIAVIAGSVGGNFEGVKNLPFSADIIEENDQFLADGNRIHHETQGRIFRDSEGRTRQEIELWHSLPDGTKLVHVNIIDPVQRVFIGLDPQNKTATIHPMGQLAPGNLPAAAKQRPTPAAPPPPNTGTPIRQPGAAQPSENLGTTEVEGFTLTGLRHTYTTPAGAMGNDKPITSVTETWFSADLQIAVISKSQSPQYGNHTRKLVNIRAGEPDPLLFQAPPDYTVKNVPQR